MSIVTRLVVALALIAGIALRGEPLEARVVDPTGAPVPNATVRVATALGSVVHQGRTDAHGVFMADIPSGSYALTVEAAGFASRQLPVGVMQPHELTIPLTVAAEHTSMTVSADRGRGENVEDAAQVVSVVPRDSIIGNPGPTIGSALAGHPGILVQQTTYGQVSPFLRGLTGYQVLNLLDGVRFNNATFRSGPNQYLAFVEPSQARRVEAMLGPASAQYGSDALGGTIQVLTADPQFASASDVELHGDWHAFGATADWSAGTALDLSIGGPHVALLVGGSARKHNDVRAGNAADSHNVYRRLFGLSDSLIRDLTGDRLQDTGFSQTGLHTKLAWRPDALSSLTASYIRSDLDHVRAYNNLLGGLGRLQALFEPQQLNFFYARYERLATGPFDSVSGTFSVNSQRDGTVRQGLRVADRITTDDSLVDAYGYAGQASTHIGRRQSLVFGAELFDEHIFSSRLERDPVTGSDAARRPLYPDDSRYVTGGAFIQDAFDLLPDRLRVQGGARITGVRYRTVEQPALGVARSEQTFRDATFNASAVLRLSSNVALHAMVGRGFRAPNANDLGAIGLNDLGYEIPSADAVAAGALLAASAGENALSTGRSLDELGPERLWNYELGLRLKTRRAYARVHVFDAELHNPIVRRTLLFPAGAAPSSLGGLAVTLIAPTPAQQAQGVVAVATEFDPRAVKAFVNDGRTRYYGVDSLVEYKLTDRWAVDGSYSYLAGRDLNPNRHVRRLPPQMGHGSLRYSPGRRWWSEARVDFAGPQERLSGGDLDDERIGASRSRRDIADFFGASLAAPWIDARGVFTPTSETLLQIQSRVLPGVGSDTVRVPLYTRTPGWAAFHLRGGLQISERAAANFGLYNVLDKNYRVHGSGADAPGFNAFAGVTYRF